MRFTHPDFDALQQEVYVAARNVFLKARENRPDETVFAYALTTYGTGSLGGCCINTIENHARVWREALTHDYTRQEHENTYKWCCADWGEGEYVDNHQEAFAAAWASYDRAMKTFCRLLVDQGQDDSEAYTCSEEHPLHNALANALEQLDREGVFGVGAARHSALVFMMQYDGDDDVVRWSIERLNPSAPEALKRDGLSWI